MSVELQPTREIDPTELAASLKQGLAEPHGVTGPGGLSDVRRRASQLRHRRRTVGAGALCALAALVVAVPLVSSSGGGSDGAVQLDTADESTATEMVVVDSSTEEALDGPAEVDSPPAAVEPEGETTLQVEEGWEGQEAADVQQDPPQIGEVDEPQPRATPIPVQLESGTYWIMEITSGGVTTQLHDVYDTMPLNDSTAMFNLHEPSGSERGLIRMSTGYCRFYEGDYATTVGHLDIDISSEIIQDPEEACTEAQQKPALEALVYSFLSSGEMEVIGFAMEPNGFDGLVALKSGDMTAMAWRVGDSSFWDGPGVWASNIDPGFQFHFVQAMNRYLGRS